MRKGIFYLAVPVLIILVAASFKTPAQTNGTLSFSVLSASTGSFSPKHCIAIWIEKSDGTFIKTKLKRAQTRVQYLNVWRTKSGDNVVDATTSATITSHQTENIIWDGTDVSGAQVPDGDYVVWMQMAYANSNGPTYSVSFTKGPSAQHLTPSDQNNFKSMTLDWAPSFVGVYDSKGKTLVEIYPNPASSLLNLHFTGIACRDATVKIFNESGQMMISGTMEVIPSMLLPVNIADLPNGLYYIKIEAEGLNFNEKFLVSR